MKFDRTFNPAACISDDKTCSHIARGAHVDRLEDGRPCLVSTDGAAMSVIPGQTSEGEGASFATGAYIPADTLEAAVKVAKKAKLADAEVKLHGGGSVSELADGSSKPLAPRPAGESFPDWRQIMQGVPTPGSDGTITLGINPELLLQVAKALGSADGVNLTIKLPSEEGSGEVCDPVHVRGNRASFEAGAFGVVMPMRPYKP